MGMHLVHSGPVVTHRLASGAQPAGQQVCANAGDISAYAKTRITSLRCPMPFPSLTIWGGNWFSRQTDPIRPPKSSSTRQTSWSLPGWHDRGVLFGSTHDATRCHELDSKLRAVNLCGKALQARARPAGVRNRALCEQIRPRLSERQVSTRLVNCDVA